jgi:hypothetical protein
VVLAKQVSLNHRFKAVKFLWDALPKVVKILRDREDKELAHQLSNKCFEDPPSMMQFCDQAESDRFQEAHQKMKKRRTDDGWSQVGS